MEMLVSSILGDLVSRSISSIAQKYLQQRASEQENLQRLHRVLLRIQTMVWEAEGRCITNQGMLQQLQMLREGMYKGYHMLDTFVYQAHEENTKDDEVSHLFSMSRFNPAKRLCLSSSSTQAIVLGSNNTRELQDMLDSLECMIADMEEFIIFLKDYPRMCRQVYSMYLLLDKCMFGRQMETEKVINFLLETEPPVIGNVGVLPIIGTSRVGKSTLVEHVSYDAKVRDNFSSIVLFTGDDLKDKTLPTLKDYGVIKHQVRASNKRSLIIIELEGDVDEGEWKRLYSTSVCMAYGSKIIVTSRSKTIANFGTTQALTLNFLPEEAYWYFFKAVVFGSTNPEEHPKLASVAMEIAKGLKGSFFGANIVGGLLRANVNTKFWCKVLKCFREFIQKHLVQFGEHPNDLSQKNKPIHLFRMVRTTEVLVTYYCYPTRSAQQEVPRITIQEMFSASVIPHGKFEALAWRSTIPPYRNFLASVVVQTPQHKVIRKRRSLKRGI